jgi:hypothetical protein
MYSHQQALVVILKPIFIHLATVRSNHLTRYTVGVSVTTLTWVSRSRTNWFWLRMAIAPVENCIPHQDPLPFWLHHHRSYSRLQDNSYLRSSTSSLDVKHLGSPCLNHRALLVTKFGLNLSCSRSRTSNKRWTFVLYHSNRSSKSSPFWRNLSERDSGEKPLTQLRKYSYACRLVLLWFREEPPSYPKSMGSRNTRESVASEGYTDVQTQPP